MKFLLVFFIFVSFFSLFATKSVLLIHGLRGSDKDMQALQNTFELNHYEVYSFSYPSTEYSIEKLVEMFLVPFIDEIDIDSLQVVTHSMGGILIRYYMQFIPDNRISQIIQIAPPNHGSEVTDFFKNSIIYKKRYGKSGQQLDKTMNKKLSLPDSVDFHCAVIAGTKSQFPVFSWFIKGKDDGKISVKRTQLKGLSDFITLPYAHDVIMQKPETIEQVLFYLENGHFKH